MCGDATNWDEDAYRETVLREREIQTRTVFRTAWAPPYTSNLDTLLVASSDGSVASYSISSSVVASKLKNPFGFVNADTDELLAEPNCFVQAHAGPAYDVKFYGDGEDALLLSCGDDGQIRGWRWKEFSSSNYSVSSQGNDIKPVLDVVNPQHKGPWGALSPVPENNAIAVNTQGGSVFAASGDSCAYCWDVETGKVKMVFKGHMDYLHCIVARNSSNQVRRMGQHEFGCTQVIDPARDLKLKGSASWVGCVALDASESWLACSSGRNISLWNLPASECVSKIPTRACVQDMSFDNNQCAPSSSFSISLHPAGVMAVGGYGCLVDVISQFGSHMCTFRCQCV
ncbi:THO complex subunit 6 [Glycine max]|nr:THO complex subunit 6 [Glycine max]